MPDDRRPEGGSVASVQVGEGPGVLDLDRAPHPLMEGMVRVGHRVDHGSRAEPGFVGEQAAVDAAVRRQCAPQGITTDRPFR